LEISTSKARKWQIIVGSVNGKEKWKKQHNGNDFYWFDTCGGWFTSHITGGHRGSNSNSANSSQKPQSIANFGLTLDPSTWHVNPSWENFLLDLLPGHFVLRNSLIRA
jgi:hypothetical protein